MNKAKILIVDDKRENILALESLLSDLPNVEIKTAQSGEEALGVLLKCKFALALLDVQMPEMSGFELASLMRGTEISSEVPIIFVTAAKGEQTIEFNGYEKGAVDVLFKPLNPHMVRSKVLVFVELFLQRQALQDRLNEVEQLKIAAEAANQAKDKFIANMSHEIRTPLSAILGFAQVLKTSKNSAVESDNFVDVILRNGNILSRLLNDLLDVAKIDAGKLSFEKKTFSILTFIESLQKMFRPLASEKGIRFAVAKSNDVPDLVLTDEFRLQQAVNNLVANALKFTSSGSITVKLSYEAEILKVDVEDTGCGLSDAAAKKIFLPFEQADSSTSRRFGGTGLGLFISRYIASELGGELELLNYKENEGCTFRLSVKAPSKTQNEQVGEVEISKDKTSEVLQGKRLLVVDDSEDLRLLISTMLKIMGAQVLAVDSGFAAQTIVQQKSFDAVLLDMQMPEMDGAETLKNLRKQGFKAPAVCVTAHATEDDRLLSLRSGFDAHVAKPVTVAKLAEVIKSLL